MSGATRRVGLLATALVLGAFAPGGAAPPEPVRAVVHVHSDLSTGEFSLEQLAALAEGQGIGALLLSETYLARVEYGVAPFRALTRVVHQERAVHDRLGRYLARVAEVRRKFPRLILVPGVEVAPHYYWTGSPLALDMTLHDTQKNLLVFGLTDPAALGLLAVTGNPAVGVWTLQSVVDALPVLLVVPGLLLLVRKRTHRRRLGPAVVVVRYRAWLAGSVLVALALTALARGWPFTTDRYSPYAPAGAAPYQALIDQVEGAGGVTVWSFPEARDAGYREVGPVRVAWATSPYPDDLLRTFRYTAFGAVYEDTTSFELPGGGWDRLLTEYAAGERSRPAWALGESGFHDATSGKRLGPIQTVLWVTERSEAGVLDALRRGRLYALQRTAELGLDLVELAAGAGGTWAISGETLRVAPGAPVEVRIGIHASDGGRHDLRVTLVRNGAVVGAWATTTPFRAVHRETADGRPVVFRLDARAAGARLLSNPIFVGR